MKKQDGKKIKNVSQNAVLEIKRHFDVVAEKLNDKISTVAEQYGDIKKDIHSMKETLDSHTEMIGSMKEDVETMKGDIATTKTDVEIIKSDIEFIKGGIKKKVDYDEFIALERRMTLLESKIKR